MQSLEKLSGLNGERGMFVGASSPAIYSSKDKRAATFFMKAKWSLDELNGLNAESIYASINNIAGIVKSTPDAAERVKAFTTLVTMATSIGSKVLLAEAFTKAISKTGDVLSTKKFLSEPTFKSDGQDFSKSSGLQLTQADINAFINNTAACFATLFADTTGNLTQNGKKAINGLMKAMESNASNPFFVAGIALNDFVLSNAKLPAKLQQSLIADRTIDSANIATLDKSYEPKPMRP